MALRPLFFLNGHLRQVSHYIIFVVNSRGADQTHVNVMSKGPLKAQKLQLMYIMFLVLSMINVLKFLMLEVRVEQGHTALELTFWQRFLLFAILANIL